MLSSALLRIGLPLCVSLAVLPSIRAAGFSSDERGVTVPVGDGGVRVEVDGARQFHVRAWQAGPAGYEPSYVVTGTLPGAKFQVKTSGRTVVLDTGPVRAGIDLDSGSVSFADASGKIILAEQGRSFSPSPAPSVGAGSGLVQVEQVFHTGEDESLYGLGQQQDGHWDWRGLPVELTQHNTVIAVPMLVSSLGYAVLWDNASKTTVNPPPEAVSLVLEGRMDDGAGSPKATEDLAKARKKNEAPAERRGSFVASRTGEYVFFATDGDRRNEFVLTVAGQEIASQRNMWVPYTLSGTLVLQAGQSVPVTLRGGGKNAKLFAGLRDKSRTVFRSRVGAGVDYRFFYGPDLNDVIAAYRTATGPAPLWPRWAFGFWQCRERYSSQQEWVDTIARFRAEKLPVDLIVQDWQYWGRYGWGAYQWDETRYPDPAAAIERLHAMNARLMVSVWPNPNGKARDALKAIPRGFIRGYYDAYNAEARKVRWSVLKQEMWDRGVDAWWQDAAEPGDPGTDVEDAPTAIGPGSRHRLAYPLFHSQSVYEGQRSAGPDKRVVILTRSAYPGQQRYAAAAWSGDINGDWTAFRRQIPAGLNFCITGLPYWTTDCGGFFQHGDTHTDPNRNELQSRWFQYSTFSPIQRVHGYQSKTEPWEWAPSTQAVMKAYTHLRYRLLPYNYSVAAAVTFAGATPMRPLVMDFPADPAARTVGDQFMSGPSILVSPVTEPGATRRNVYLPAGTGWVDFWTGETLSGGRTITAAAPPDRLPLYVRAGAIIPMGPEVQYADEQPDAPLELRIYPGADGSFTLYDDKGDGYAYERGERSTLTLNWNNAARTLTLGERQGGYPGMPEKRVFKVVLLRPGEGYTGSTPADAREVVYTGKPRTLRLP